MKAGRQIDEIATILHEQLPLKKDYIAPTEKIIVNDDLSIELDGKGTFMPTRYALQQMAANLGIPWSYADRMMNEEALDLMSDNYNHWLHNYSQKRMIRTLLDPNDPDEPVIRAYLSDRYRQLDNWDLLSVVLPVIQDRELVIRSCEITETKLYLKATLPSLQMDVKVGDTVESGVVISNSEVGDGSVQVKPLIYRLVCTNGMISQASIRKYHIGSRLGNGSENIEHLLTDETREADDKAFWMKVRDVVTASFDEAFFNEQVQKLQIAAGLSIKKNVEEVVEKTRKWYGLPDSTGSRVLENLIRSSEYSKWGLANAVSATANTTEDYEAATTLETISGQIIELPNKDWELLAA